MRLLTRKQLKTQQDTTKTERIKNADRIAKLMKEAKDDLQSLEVNLAERKEKLESEFRIEEETLKTGIANLKGETTTLMSIKELALEPIDRKNADADKRLKKAIDKMESVADKEKELFTKNRIASKLLLDNNKKKESLDEREVAVVKDEAETDNGKGELRKKQSVFGKSKEEFGKHVTKKHKELKDKRFKLNVQQVENIKTAERQKKEWEKLDVERGHMESQRRTLALAFSEAKRKRII